MKKQKMQLYWARHWRVGLLIPILSVLALVGWQVVRIQAQTIPTISIVSVAKDSSVTVETHNYPANESFVVTMGKMGSRGVDGYKVADWNSGAGGAQQATFTIPEALKGDAQIAIRLQSMSGYYSFNWFYNNAAATTPPTSSTPGSSVPGYTGYPTFSVTAVTGDTDVTVQTKNLPPNQSFRVTMGAYGTRGVNGTLITTTDSGAGGSQTFTYAIPKELKGMERIAIRLESAAGYFAYNWFYNSSTGTTSPSNEPPKATPIPAPGYVGTPSFGISAVQRDNTVTIAAKNFPPNRDFRVTMGAYGTRGVNGTLVTTTMSGEGGDFTATYNIPAALQGSARIAIRLESADGFYAYNWFYNNNAP